MDKPAKSDYWALPQRQFYFRTLIIFSVVGTLISYRSWPEFDLLSVSLSVIMLIYLALSGLFAKRLLAGKELLLERGLGWTDSTLIGASLCLVDFQILPTVLFATIIQFNAAMHGGSRKWLEDNLAFIFGAGLGAFVYTPVWVLTSSVNVSATSLIGVCVYIVLSGLYMNMRNRSLSQQVELQKEQLERSKTRAFRLSRYLSPTVWQAVSSENDKMLQTDRKRLTIFFSDIQGFTALSEELEAETLAALLNTYLTEMTKIIAHYGGTVDKFMGDGIMVIFGDNETRGAKADCLRCVTMALAMRKRMKVLQNHWLAQGIKRKLEIRMGINTGFCTVGTFGAKAYYQDYTVLGTHVNLASRLESAASPGEILLSHESWALVKDTILCTNKGMVKAKGFSYPIEVYQVIDLRKNLGGEQSYLETSLEGFSMQLDLDKVRNYDRDRVMDDLEKALESLRDRMY
ncbi:adenylate/guanylate cyclase domain-containing protein [Halioxenophilus sp. WMMB6]|uniref:adenylate/guanylate cyclase domain-containing protein n=1 Tax=Halioxenophilus sp. WMMB6 TaxID=3073815 RepID=UPI00295EF585|nr:adenylate/guanylate cyclase domain-containing protein [Halioxenophilus sp. WMMB6]